LKFTDSQGGLPSFLALLLILFATSLWAQSSLSPVIDHGDVTLYKPWLDSFNHAQKIAAFASSHGFRTLNHMLLSGKAASLYHYASYIIPAELCALTPTTAYQSFCGFLVPLGFLLSGLAAFVLIRSFWRPWAGFAACAVLFLVPDPSQMGMGNHFLSYHWLQQIAPGGLYAVALMALAWIFMFEGCKSGSVARIVISYVLWGVTANYKIHIFFANALPMAVYPAIFFRRSSKLIKCLWFFASLTLLGLMMKFTEQISLMPLIKLDGSAFHPYTSSVISMFDSDLLKQFFTHQLATHFQAVNQCWTVALMSVMLVTCTFGVVGLLYFIMIGLLRGKIDPGLLFFPLIIIVNYLIMSLGLAFDSHGIARPEELLHRPFVWAYFAVTAWTGGMIYLRFKDILSRSGKVRKVILGIVFLSLLFPLYLGRHIQLGPSWGKTHTDHAVPTGLVKACDFIRTHSEKNDIVQDSQNDRKAIVTALSERQSYVIDYFFIQAKLMTEQKDRLSAIAFVKKMTDPQAIVDFFVKRHIKWFILHPEDDIPWRKDLSARCAYESHGYRIYFFQDR